MPSSREKAWEHVRRNEKLRRVRKQIKRNRKTKRTRSRDLMPDSLDDLDELYTVQQERVMPKGEKSRRKQVLSAALETLAKEDESARLDAAFAQSVSSSGFAQEQDWGIVVEVSSGLCRVKLDGRTLLCSVRGGLSAEDSGFTNVVAVGDRVEVFEEGARPLTDSGGGIRQGVIEAVLPRKSALVRPDVFNNRLQQVIVANADQVLIVAAWQDPPLWLELVDRYLIAAARFRLHPVICVNKIDLAADRALCESKMAPYQELGYDVLLTSALDGEGILELADLLRNKTTVLAGMSGVGKSSLLRGIQPDLQLRVGTVSDHSGEGRHTTTQVNLIELELGGFVVDTPGIREFGLSGLAQSRLIDYYPRLADLQGDCRFADCSHTHEPGCAVKRALDQGEVSPDRYHSYCAIYASLE